MNGHPHPHLIRLPLLQHHHPPINTKCSGSALLSVRLAGAPTPSSSTTSTTAAPLPVPLVPGTAGAGVAESKPSAAQNRQQGKEEKEEGSAAPVWPEAKRPREGDARSLSTMSNDGSAMMEEEEGEGEEGLPVVGGIEAARAALSELAGSHFDADVKVRTQKRWNDGARNGGGGMNRGSPMPVCLSLSPDVRPTDRPTEITQTNPK